LCGRKTYEAIRKNLKEASLGVVVLSEQKWYHGKLAENSYCVPNITEALLKIGYINKNNADVLIIGGGSVFNQTKHLWDEAYITHVESEKEIEADVHLSDVLEGTTINQGQIVYKGKEGELHYTIVHYTR
jgi:dihydrofolate reductase